MGLLTERQSTIHLAAKSLSRSIYHNEQSLNVKAVAYFISYLEVCDWQ